MSLKDKLPLINERIRFDKLQTINHEGQNLGVISRNEGLKIAHEVGLDLVLITEKGSEGFPVAKIMDFGKVIYAKKKKATEAKKKQKVIKVKETKIRPKISDHDLQIKIKQAIQFLQEGKRVKVNLVFKGREVANRNEMGTKLFEKIDDFFSKAELKNLSSEPDVKMGPSWSRMYFLK